MNLQLDQRMHQPRTPRMVSGIPLWLTVFILGTVNDLLLCVCDNCLGCHFEDITVFFSPVIVKVLYLLANISPPFPHYFETNVGRGLILEYPISRDYTPAQKANM